MPGSWQIQALSRDAAQLVDNKKLSFAMEPPAMGFRP